MDYLFTPWRYAYVKQPGPEKGCLFCRALKHGDDREALIVYRGRHNFILLNRYPYTNGHVMIAPLAHGGELDNVPAETLSEMILLCQRVQRALAAEYRPDGYNLGMNLAKVAGAGVADHLHMHVLPRWAADTNFMTTAGETRLLPEDLSTTYDKLRRHFQR